MKRDFDLIRELLLRVEEDRPPDEIPGIDDATRIYHIRLLKQAGLVEAIDYSTLSGPDFEISGLTWEGHDFLDQARNAAIWNKVKRTLKEQAVTVSLSVLKSLLAKAAREHLGLSE